MSDVYSIFCTLSTDVSYTFYSEADPNTGVRTPVRLIKINGKANIPDKRFLTPRGAVTAVTDEEVSRLNEHPVFIAHKQNGFIAIEKRGTDVEKVVSNDMVPRDESAPLEPGDFNENDPKPIISEQQSREAQGEPESATILPGVTKRGRRANTSKATLG